MSPLKFEVVGTGKDLALIHGWGLGSAAWASVVDTLAQRCRVHLVDLAGYESDVRQGFDAAGNNAPSIQERFAGNAQRLIESLPAGVTLCGWSMGGALALQAALQAPAHIARLILVGATPCFAQRDDWSIGQPLALLSTFKTAVAGDTKAALQRFIALLNQGDTQARVIARTLLGGLAKNRLPSGEVLGEGLDFLRDIDLRQQMPSLQTPTLLIHGALDPLVPLAAAHWLAEHLPQSRLEIFSGAAHAPFLNDPERFATLVADFCHASASS